MFKYKPSVLKILLVITVVLTGCDLLSSVDKQSKIKDLQLEPVTSRQVEALAGSGKIKVNSSYRQSPYVCIVSTKNKVNSEYKYTYRAYWLHFPETLVAESNGEKQHVIYKLDDEETLRLAQCTIPAAKGAYDAMVELLEFKANKNKVTRKPKTPNTGQSKFKMCLYTYTQTVYVFSMDGRLLATWDEIVCVGAPIGDGGGGGGGTPPGDGGTDWGDDYPPGGGGSGDGTWEGHGDESDPCSGPEITIGCTDKPYLDPFIPCAGDPVPSPEIAPTDGQGAAGGLYGAPRADGTPHKGLDIKSPIDGPLYSMFDGVVYSAIESTGDFGNYIIIQSNYGGDIIYILYAHLNSINVNGGDIVSAGILIGRTGKTGNANDPDIVPHVHIEVRKQVPQYGYNNAPHFNPENYMATTFDENGNPIPPENCN